MNRNEAINNIQVAVGKSWCQFLMPYIDMLDSRKPAESLDKVKSDMADYVAHRPPESQIQDCDDEALAKVGHKVSKYRGWMGVAHNSKHCFAVLVDEDGVFWVDAWGRWERYTDIISRDSMVENFKLRGVRFLPIKCWLKGRFITWDIVMI